MPRSRRKPRPGQLGLSAADQYVVHDEPHGIGPLAVPARTWSAEHLDALLAGSARLLVDRSARISFANAEARSLLAIGPDNANRSTLIDIVAPDHLAGLLKRLADQTSDEWREHVEVRGPGGDRVPVDLRAVGRVDGVWVVEVSKVPTVASTAVLLEIASALLEGAEATDPFAAEEHLRDAMGHLGDALGVDRASMFAFDTADPLESKRSILWARSGADHPGLPVRWWIDRLEQSGGALPQGSSAIVTCIPDTSKDPEAAMWQRIHVAATLAVRASIGGGWDVTIGMSTTDRPREWTENDIQMLRSVAAILGNSVRRAQAAAEARAHHQALVASEARMRSTIMDAPALIFRIDRTTKLLLANREAARYGEVEPEDLVGQRLVDFVDGEMRDGLLRDVEHVFETGEGVDSVICLPTPKHGDVWLDCRGVPERGAGGQVETMLLFAIDITDRRAMEEQIRLSANVDPLTGLANRRSALERLGEVLSSASDPVAVLFVDLDRFKHTNDSLGHAGGDIVLQAVGEALRSVSGPDDIVARLGGDEFAIVMPDARDLVDLVRRVERVRGAIANPIDVGSQTVLITASIGVAIANPGDDVSADLLRLADVAMYQAKTRGRNRFEIFDEHLRTAVDERVGTENALRQALPRKQFEVFYQPEVMLDDGRLVGLEALVRWRHPERGLLAAGSFIHIAEESTLISDIGRFVLTEACQQAGEWTRSYPDLPLTLRVNVSGRQLVHASLLRDVTVALAESRLPPDRLCLEITETALMTDIDTTIQMLRWIRELGVRLAIDDFGTGYSSLGYLERFPINTLKVDRSFVVGLGEDPKSSAIVRTLVSLAQVLDLEVVAEGVETIEQARVLRSLGCTTAQGYLYSPPLQAAEVEPHLRAGAVLPKER